MVVEVENKFPGGGGFDLGDVMVTWEYGKKGVGGKVVKVK